MKKHVGSVPGNLPLSLTSFIGRERELAEVKRLLSIARVVTLTGAGGCGKTRLALQAANQLEDFPDGVWLVDLAPLADPALIAQAVASVFDLYQVSETPIVALLQNFLQLKNLLRVLDNCEHLIQGCADLCDALLRACPDLEIVAMMRTAFPDLHATIEDMTAEGDKTWARVTFRGSNRGDFMDRPPTGKPAPLRPLIFAVMLTGRW